MNKATITAVIPAKHEEENIARAVSSVLWCDRVIVIVERGDTTGEIAKKKGAEVMEIEPESDYFKAVQKNINLAIDEAETDWILRIDADEEVTNDLRDEIREMINKPSEHVAYGLPRNQFFLGAFLKGGDWYYDRLVRLFKSQYARYDPLVSVHEQFKVDGSVGYLSHKLNHYSHPTLSVALTKFNRYTSLEVEDLDDSFSNALIKMIVLPPYIFLRWIIWHNGWRDGTRGIIAAFLRSFYEFLLYAKRIEKLKSKK